MPRRFLLTAAGCAILCVAAGLWLAGCDRTAPAPTTDDQRKQTTQLADPDQVYTVRGRIVDLPDPSRPASGFQVRHEAIDDFVGSDGRIVGMDAMTMPFTPARELSLEDFEIGDKVELVFEVRWKTQPLSRVVEIRKLPPDTELEFRPKRTPSGEQGGDQG